MSPSVQATGPRVKSLLDLVALKRGYDLPSQDREDGEIPILGSFGITGRHIRARGRGPGVSIGRSGASIGVATYTDRPFWPLNTTLYVTDFKGNDPRFVYYVLDSIDFRAFNSGGAIPSLNRNYLGAINVPDLAVSIQGKIAAILSAYDDLIENNNGRIKLLDEMAWRIYHEWFADFRYPGHEDVPLVDSELGSVPEGWRVTTLGELFSVVLGGTPSRKVARYWATGTIPWINSGQVNALRVLEPSELITEEALESSNAKLMPPGTTLVAITGATLGQVSLLGIPACANQSVVGIYDPTDRLAEYLYLTVRESIERIIGAASGGAQQHINKQIVRETLISVPRANLSDRFQHTVRAMFDGIVRLSRAQLSLRATRDLLVPRLISGEIDVTDLDIAMPDAAA